MSLTRQDYINYLINEARRLLIPLNAQFYETLYSFLKSSDGEMGFDIFKQLDPNRVGVHYAPQIKHIFRRIFDI